MRIKLSEPPLMTSAAEAKARCFVGKRPVNPSNSGSAVWSPRQGSIAVLLHAPRPSR